MARRNYDGDTTISPPTVATVEFTTPGNQKVRRSYGYIPVSSSRNYYTELQRTDGNPPDEVKTKTVTDTTSILAAANPSVLQSYGKEGVPNGNPTQLIVNRTEVETEYKQTDDGPVAVKETRKEYISESAFAGHFLTRYAVTPQGSSVPEPLVLSNAFILTGVTIVEYEANEFEGITKTLTSRYLALGLTAEGKAAVQTRQEDATTVGELAQIVGDMQPLVFDGIETRISTGRDYGVQLRPSEQAGLWQFVVDTNGRDTPADEAIVAFSFGKTRRDGFNRSFNSEPLATPPDDPALGDQWEDLDGNVSLWDGIDWILISSTPPTSPTLGDKYIDADTGDEFVFAA